MNPQEKQLLQDMSMKVNQLVDLYYRSHQFDRNIFDNPVYFRNKVSFFGVNPVTIQAAPTTALTDLTHTAPGTPDYALQDLVDSASGSAFGFATKDEGNTVLKVILNLQTRITELETKLQAFGLLS